MSGQELVMRVALVLVVRRRIVAAVTTVGTAATLLGALLLPARYTSTTTFVPESSGRNLPTGLSGLAGQFGISLGSDGTRSPRFYGDLLVSREVLEKILLTRYPEAAAAATPTSGRQLLDLLTPQSVPEVKRLTEGLKRLRKATQVSVNYQTGVVSLSVDAPSPTLAAAVANRFVTYLNEFNLDSRQSQARQRRRFLEGRVLQGEHDLRAAEDSLKLFLQRNRQFESSPQLTFEYNRLQRQLQMGQEIYVTVRREYELARIEEVNTTPVITVIDTAVAPYRRSKPRRRVIVGLGATLSLLLGFAVAFGAEGLARARRADNREYRELVTALRAAARFGRL